MQFKNGQRIQWMGRDGKTRTGAITKVQFYDLVVEEERKHARTGKSLASRPVHVWQKHATIIGDTTGA